MSSFKKILLGLYLLSVPFYDGTCSRNFAVGFPFSFFTQTTNPAATTPFKPLLIVANLVIVIALVFLLEAFFKSDFYNQRRPLFKVSRILSWFYATYFYLLGWGLILFYFKPSVEGNLLNLAYILYLYPMIYFGLLPLYPVFAVIENHLSPLQLMPVAWALTFGMIFVVGYFLSKMYLWIKARLA